jgi:ribose 5-phosphate isomerase B
MVVLLASDHAGFALKEVVKRDLKQLGYTVQDEGAFAFKDGDDYPDFIKLVAKQVSADPDNSRGIIFGGSGEGEAIVANRFPRVRATVYYGGPVDIITLSRLHNNANILSIGARFVTEIEAQKAIHTWLTTEFPGEERHVRRIAKIDSTHEADPEF